MRKLQSFAGYCIIFEDDEKSLDISELWLNELAKGVIPKIKSPIIHVLDTGFEFSEKVQAGFAVLGLPNELEYLARNLRADEDDLNMSYLKSKLVEEERRINNKNNIGTEPENVKASTTKRRPFAKNEQFMKNKIFTNKPQFSKEVTNEKYGQERFHQFLRCYRCLEIGHIGKNCPLSVNKIVYADESDYQELSTSRAAAFSVMQQSTSMSILNHRQKTDSGTCILDSGCTDHDITS
ncbi:hypothetical protein JTB14_037914 [Gonioctena quinquepunctata]|nr:hypothetical protein JTB14_037914 [Gonioctena quinquepunctata]